MIGDSAAAPPQDPMLGASSGIGERESQARTRRNRRAMATAGAGVFVRGSSALCILITTPIALSYLGAERFGLWLTIAGVVAVLGASDLGVGAAVMNRVSRAYGLDDRAMARQTVAGGMVTLGIVGVVLLSGILLVVPQLPIDNLYHLNHQDPLRSEALSATMTFLILFAAGLPGSLIAQLRNAYQEGYVQAVVTTVGNLGAIPATLIVVRLDLGVTGLVIAFAGIPVLLAIFNAVHLFKRRPWLLPRAGDVSRRAMGSVFRIGIAFLVLQIAYVIAFSSDTVLAGTILGPQAVTDYSIVLRLFAIPAALAAIVTAPLWPAYGEASARGDHAWIGRALRRSVALSAAATIPIVLILIVSGPYLVARWTDERVHPDWWVYVGMGAFVASFAVANAFAMFLNGIQALKFQALTMTAMAIVNIVGSIILARLVGVAGIVFASVIAIGLLLIVPDVIYARRVLRGQ